MCRSMGRASRPNDTRVISWIVTDPCGARLFGRTVVLQRLEHGRRPVSSTRPRRLAVSATICVLPGSRGSTVLAGSMESNVLPSTSGVIAPVPSSER